MSKPNAIVLFLLSLFFISCQTENAPETRGPIVFGDSSLIVTEHDTQLLSNNVPDFIPQNPGTDTSTIKTEETVKDTVKILSAPPVAAVAKSNNTNGLQAPFKSLDVFIEGIEAKPAKNINWERASSASFTLNKGELNSKSMVIGEATATKVTQRYQAVLMVKTPSGKAYKLPGFPVHTEEWQTLKKSGNRFVVSGLADNQLHYDRKFSANALKNAVQKLARSNRMSKKEEEQLIRSVRNVRSPKQAPLDIALQSVVWKINATDAKGKAMEREIRVDINR